MKRIFISSLGTKKHIECRYALGNWVSEPVLFPQEALIQKLCKDWNRDDRIYILCTPEAQKNNWEGRKGFGEGLKSRLESMSLHSDVVSVTVPDGKEINDGRETIREILNIIPDDSRVFLDLSYSVRLMPFLQAISLYCSKVALNTEIAGIYYGPSELLGPPEKIRQIPLEERIVPILDITELWAILEFTGAVFLAEQAGQVDHLRHWLKKHGGSDAFPQKLKDSLLTLCNIFQSISLMRYPNQHALELPEDFGEYAGLTSLYIQIGKSLFKGLTEAVVPEGFYCSRWCLSRGMALQACLYARKAIIKALADSGYTEASTQEWDRFLIQVSKLPEPYKAPSAKAITFDHIGIAGEALKEGFRTVLFNRNRLCRSSLMGELAQIWSKAIKNSRLKALPESCRKLVEENEAVTRELAQKYARLLALIDDMVQGEWNVGLDPQDPEAFRNLCEKVINEAEDALKSFLKALESAVTPNRACSKKGV